MVTGRGHILADIGDEQAWRCSCIHTASPLCLIGWECRIDSMKTNHTVRVSEHAIEGMHVPSISIPLKSIGHCTSQNNSDELCLAGVLYETVCSTTQQRGNWKEPGCINVCTQQHFQLGRDKNYNLCRDSEGCVVFGWEVMDVAVHPQYWECPVMHYVGKSEKIGNLCGTLKDLKTLNIM